jgi:hypothetical protein
MNTWKEDRLFQKKLNYFRRWDAGRLRVIPTARNISAYRIAPWLSPHQGLSPWEKEMFAGSWRCSAELLRRIVSRE